MLFNSVEFIFVFLPLAVAVHFLLARWSTDAAIIGTTLSSLLFYAWWNPPYVLLPVLSIVANFWFARAIVRSDPAGSRRLLIIGRIEQLAVLFDQFLGNLTKFRQRQPRIDSHNFE